MTKENPESQPSPFEQFFPLDPTTEHLYEKLKSSEAFLEPSVFGRISEFAAKEIDHRLDLAGELIELYDELFEACDMGLVSTILIAENNDPARELKSVPAYYLEPDYYPDDPEMTYFINGEGYCSTMDKMLAWQQGKSVVAIRNTATFKGHPLLGDQHLYSFASSKFVLSVNRSGLVQAALNSRYQDINSVDGSRRRFEDEEDLEDYISCGCAGPAIVELEEGGFKVSSVHPDFQFSNTRNGLTNVADMSVAKAVEMLGFVRSTYELMEYHNGEYEEESEGSDYYDEDDD